MDWIFIIIAGAIIGWLGSLIMNTDEQQGALLNIVIGIVGSLLGRWIFVDLLNISSASSAGAFSWAGIFWGVLGAIILIAILKSFNAMRRAS